MNLFKRLCATALLLPGVALAAEWPTYPFVHANATASTFVVPNTVSISFDIVSVQADPQVGMQEVDAGIARIRTLVDGLGDKDATVEVQDIRKGLRPDKSGAKRDDQAPQAEPLYEVKASASITVRDMAVWKVLVTELIGMRDLDSPSSMFSHTEQAQIENELMAQALRKARLKAESIASGLGRRIDSVGAASSGPLANLTNAIGFGPPEQQRVSASGRVNGPLRNHLDAPALKFSQSVDVVFKLK